MRREMVANLPGERLIGTLVRDEDPLLAGCH
jgi:hypothetical protein